MNSVDSVNSKEPLATQGLCKYNHLHNLEQWAVLTQLDPLEAICHLVSALLVVTTLTP